MSTVGKVVLVLVALPVGLALVAGGPLGLWALLALLSAESGAMRYMPGMALYVLGFCVPVGLYHWYRKGTGATSGPARLPGVVWCAVGAAAAVVLGQLLLAVRADVLFSLCFLLAAALPPLAALAWAAMRLWYLTTWRRLMAGWLCGSLVSTFLAVLLTVSVSLLAYALVLPLRAAVDQLLRLVSPEQRFFSPWLTICLVEMALVAPLVEELTKPLAAALLARRLRGPAEAFLVGMAGGVGFAILENMLYEAAGAQTWASVATLRGVGGVLHPLNAGLVAVGWYGVRHGLPGAWQRLFGLYGLAVGVHALWNGGLVILYSGIGAHLFGVEQWQLNVYGVGRPGVVVAFMLVEALALWRLLLVVTDRLRDPAQPDPGAALALHLEQPRRLALWALGLAFVLVPLGALYGPLVARYADRLVPVQ